MANFFKELFFGKPEQLKEYNPYNSQQQQGFSDILKQAMQGNQNALQYLNSLLSDEPEAYEDFERPFMDQFEQQTIPSILERFTGAGARSSSALNQTLGQAGRQLSGDLATQRAGLKQNAMSQLQNYSQMGFTPQKQPYVQGATQGLFQQLAPAAGQFAGNSFTNLLGMLGRGGMGGMQNSYNMPGAGQQAGMQTNAPRFL